MTLLYGPKLIGSITVWFIGGWVIKAIARGVESALKDPMVFIAVSALADSPVNFAVKAWVNAADYWGVYFELNENVYKTFSSDGLNIPYPQMDIYIHQETTQK